jgi:hypothetical protein
MEVVIGFIFIQIAASVVAGLTNFSAIGLMVAGFIDVILMALLIYYAVNKLS